MTCLVVWLLLGGTSCADEQKNWSVSLQVESGNDAAWISPDPLGVNYLRYYEREDFTFKIDVWLFTWINVIREFGTTFTELAGPIPPDGRVIYEDYIYVEENQFTAEALLILWIDGAGYVHLEVRDFTASMRLRVTVTGRLKVLQTDTVFGDMNGDDMLNDEDAELLRAWLAEWPMDAPPAAAMDLDNDGAVSIKDVLMIQHFFLGNLLTAYQGWNF
ncbi:MAG: dockerin type I repeat-containing protein [Acidobacteria bacterium]|nr:dockerin type I repeat-containing protein [Acidobacteriota bacterium]